VHDISAEQREKTASATAKALLEIKAFMHLSQSLQTKDIHLKYNTYDKT
jgi:hypothetical protein